MKRAGNALSTLIAGRAVHATNPFVGGFVKPPDDEGIKKSIEELRKIRPVVLDLIEVFHSWDEKFERDTDFVALSTRDFSFLEGEIKSSRGMCIKERDYLEHLIKIVIPYSSAPGFEFEGEEFMVGALSRMNINRESLHPQTRQDAAEFLKAFPSNNIFHNNLAQALEILHSIDHATDLLENTRFKKENLQKPVINEEKVGVGVIEAPRGTLYYKLTVGKTAKIKKATVIVPTAQNQINIEKDIAKLVEDKINTMTKEQIQYELEKLIRSYDPCMSCASHFLKINWM